MLVTTLELIKNYGKMMIQYWESRAKETLEQERRISQKGIFYYESIIDTVIKFLKPSVILKTDLWNEGIEPIGGNLETLAKNHSGLGIYGIDVSRLVCSEARKRLRQARIIEADIRAIPFKDDVFDTVLDMSTCDHLSFAELPTCLKEYQRVLKKDGRLIMVFNNYSLYSYVRGNVQPSRFRWAFPKSSVEKVFRKCFEITFERGIDLIGWFPFSSKITQYCPRLLNFIKKIETSDASKKLNILSQSYLFVGENSKQPWRMSYS